MPATQAVSVGTQRLVVPIPSGFVDAGAALPTFHDYAQRLLAPQSRLLLALLEPAEVEALRRGRAGGQSRSVQVATLRELESQVIGVQDFAAIRARVRALSQQESLERQAHAANEHLPGAIARLNEEGGMTLSSKVERMVSQGVFEESNHSISMLALANYSVGTAGGTVQQQMAQASGFALVRGKVLVMTVYTPLRSPADMEWARNQVRLWQAGVQAGNP